MGQMPVLEVDGQRVHQSGSIARYLAKRVGLAGANDWENLQIDSVVDTINDFRTSMSRLFISCYVSLLINLLFYRGRNSCMGIGSGSERDENGQSEG